MLNINENLIYLFNRKGKNISPTLQEWISTDINMYVFERNGKARFIYTKELPTFQDMLDRFEKRWIKAAMKFGTIAIIQAKPITVKYEEWKELADQSDEMKIALINAYEEALYE